jgi:hypothetical protein
MSGGMLRGTPHVAAQQAAEASICPAQPADEWLDSTKEGLDIGAKGGGGGGRGGVGRMDA